MKMNKKGVPLWAIKRLLMCRVNLSHRGYQSFQIEPDGNIFVDHILMSHVDCIYFDESIQGYCIPVSKQAF